MNFLNTDLSFDFYQLPNSTCEFYYKGTFDREISKIVKSLDEGEFPYGLKGNFAFFFKNQKKIYFAVDHLPTYNLFWRTDQVGHIFYNLKKSTDTEDPVMLAQRKLLYGGTVGPKTTYKEIKRLEAGTFFEKDLMSGKESIKEYIDLNTHYIDTNITINDISQIIEDSVEQHTRTPFALLWSSGTDSNCIYGFIRKLQRTENCTLISLYSSASSSDERSQIEELEKIYKVKTNYYDLKGFTGLTDDVKNRYYSSEVDDIYKTNYRRFWDGFWWEPNLFQKYLAVNDLNLLDIPTLTGEAGDQQFGSRYSKMMISLLVQVPDIEPADLISGFLTLEIFSQRKKWFRPNEEWIRLLERNQNLKIAYEELHTWAQNIWNKIDTGGDIINRCEILLNRLKCSRLLYGYTQLKGTNFVHPFADYRLFHTMYKTPGTWKIQEGKTRRISREVIKDYVDQSPWTWPKSGIEALFVPKSRNIVL